MATEKQLKAYINKRVESHQVSREWYTDMAKKNPTYSGDYMSKAYSSQTVERELEMLLTFIETGKEHESLTTRVIAQDGDK